MWDAEVVGNDEWMLEKLHVFTSMLNGFEDWEESPCCFDFWALVLK